MERITVNTCSTCDHFTDTVESKNRKYCKLHNHLTFHDKGCSWWIEKRKA